MHQEAEGKRDAEFKEIEDYISTAELGTTKYLAFSDAIARNDIYISLEKLKNNKWATTSHLDCLRFEQAAINETIRVRKDTVPGYFREMESIQALYRNAVTAELSVLNAESDHSSASQLDAGENVIRKMSRLRMSILRGSSKSTTN